MALPRGDSAPILLLLAVLAGAVVPPNNTLPLAMPVDLPPTVNITFIKEVTLTVSPADLELTPHEEQEVAGFLESGLRMLDPIMRFFDGLVGWSPPPQPERVHV